MPAARPHSSMSPVAANRPVNRVPNPVRNRVRYPVPLRGPAGRSGGEEGREVLAIGFEQGVEQWAGDGVVGDQGVRHQGLQGQVAVA